jgi:hypothetical protein
MDYDVPNKAVFSPGLTLTRIKDLKLVCLPTEPIAPKHLGREGTTDGWAL